MPDSRLPPVPGLRQGHLRTILFGALALTVAGVLAATAFSVWRLRVEAIATAFEIAATNARGLEDHLTQNLRAVELAAGAGLPWDPAATGGEAGRPFAEILSHAPFLRSLSLADATGRIVASSNPANVGQVVPTDGFLPPAGGDAEILRVGPAWAGRDFAGGRPATAADPVAADGLSFVPLLRAYRRPGGPVMLLATVNPDYFINHLERALAATAGTGEVVRYDGSLLLSTDRNARPGAADGRLATLMQGGEAAFGRAEEERPDGRVALTSFRMSRLYPVAVVTRLDRDAVLARWRADAIHVAAVIVPMLAVVSLLAVGFYRRQSQLLVERAEAERLTRLNSTVFESSTDSIVITDPEARIVSVNPAFTRICGYGPEEAIGRNPRMLASGLQGKGFYDQMWQEILARDGWQGEIVNRRKDGSLYTAQLSITAFRRPDGKLLHYVGVSSDITERKRQEARIDELNRTLAQRVQEAEAANRAKTAFLANMSHELRTPLHAIMGMADLVLRATTEPKQRARLEKVKHASRHLVEIIGDILDISRIEADRLALDRVALRLGEVLEGVEAIVGQKAAEKGLALTVEIDPVLADRRLWGDPLRLSQILVNLAGNAVKFTAGGSVRIAFAMVAEEADEVLLRCAVRDTGIGIREEDLGGLFRPFAQVDDSMTRAYGGTGLGLAISRSLAHLMGGEIGVESRFGEGSTFWFTCRLGAAESPPDPRPDRGMPAVVAQLHEDLAGARVLLAEDDPLNRELALEVLRELAASVDVAADGEEAVHLARAGDYDIVLMDLNMPRLNGIDATLAIRAFPDRADLPILAMTANAFDGDRRRCLAAGMNDVLVKPVGRDELFAAIARWLPPRP